MKKKNKILFLIIILFILLVVAIVALKSQKKEIKTTTTNEQENIVSYYEDNNIDKLDKMSERERIKFYFSQYIENIENKAYDKAYSMLYSEFKQKYFPTVEDYIKYIQKKYPEVISLNYDDIQTEGYYYILTITFFDVVKDTEFTQKFVIREFDFNNIAISFQAE